MNSDSQLLLRNARVVLPSGVAEGASVYIEGDRVARITRPLVKRVHSGKAQPECYNAFATVV